MAIYQETYMKSIGVMVVTITIKTFRHKHQDKAILALQYGQHIIALYTTAFKAKILLKKLGAGGYVGHRQINMIKLYTCY
jgi:hypothetical protein